MDQDFYFYQTEILKNYVLDPYNPYEIWIPRVLRGCTGLYKYFLITHLGIVKVDTGFIHFSPIKLLDRESLLRPFNTYPDLIQITKKELVESTVDKTFIGSYRSDDHDKFEIDLLKNLKSAIIK